MITEVYDIVENMPDGTIKSLLNKNCDYIGSVLSNAVHQAMPYYLAFPNGFINTVGDLEKLTARLLENLVNDWDGTSETYYSSGGMKVSIANDGSVIELGASLDLGSVFIGSEEIA